MAFGTHWEWRGFGRLPDDTAERIRALGEPVNVGAPRLADTYLHTPTAHDNVKLRDGRLKLKRLLARHAPGIELWREDEGEIFSFPLDAAQADAFCHALGCRPSPGESGWSTSAENLVEALGEFDPPIQKLDVVKVREQRRVRHDGLELLMEISRIKTPQAVDSVSIEGPALGTGLESGGDPAYDKSLEGLRALAEDWQLARSLKPQNYMEMLAVWFSSGR